MGNFIKENKMVIAIVIGCVILGGFFYATQVSKQNSIEKQQQIEIQTKVQERKDQEKAAELQRSREALGKSSCASEAVKAAVDHYKSSSLCRGFYASSEECNNGTYLVANYNSAYEICLQRKGLK